MNNSELHSKNRYRQTEKLTEEMEKENNKFEGASFLIFGLIFLILALFSFVGYLSEYDWCKYSTIFFALTALILFYEFSKVYKKI